MIFTAPLLSLKVRDQPASKCCAAKQGAWYLSALKYGVVWFGTVWCSILWWDMRVLLGIVCCGVVLLVGQMQELYVVVWYADAAGHGNA